MRVKEIELLNVKTEISTNEFEPGIYIYRIIVNNKMKQNGKIVIVN